MIEPYKFVVKRVRIESTPDSSGKTTIVEKCGSLDKNERLLLEYSFGEISKTSTLTIYNGSKTIQMFPVQSLCRIEMDYYTNEEMEDYNKKELNKISFESK